MTSLEKAEQCLSQVFGYPTFRPLQRQALAAILNGEDCLIVMPTGSGKSLCYQIPAIIGGGLTIVVSPLVALMQDQVDSLIQFGVSAGMLNSTQSPQQQSEVWARCEASELKLLYLAPERLQMPGTLQRLKRQQVAMVAIDEAHCVSQWGHDFRPDYRGLADVIDQFDGAVRVALTATATRETRADILEQLGMQNATRVLGGFDRPNIFYAVQPKTDPQRQLSTFLQNRRGQAGIVYCLSRKKVEATAARLADAGWPAEPYHAGLPEHQRLETQRAFLAADDRIIVATIAFGMGIDKPNVRFVVHLDLPKSLEAYYQETGRAGRDGEPADAWMLFGMQDVVRLRQMLAESSADSAHQRAEQLRLDSLLAWCETVACRRAPLLHYFDQAEHAACGNCDNCLAPPETYDATEPAQKILSAIYRTGQQFGAAYLIDVLRGIESERIRHNGHDQLSLFGSGAALKARQWRELLRQLIADGAIIADPARYGGLVLQERCRDILRGERLFLARRTSDASSLRRLESKPSGALPPDIDQALWEALRECRRTLASEHGVPPYLIFHDKTLMALARLKPLDGEAMLAVNGVGKAKLERFGDSILTTIAEFS